MDLFFGEPSRYELIGIFRRRNYHRGGLRCQPPLRRRNIAGKGKGFRRLVSKTAVRAFPVVVLTPSLDQLSRFLQRREPVFIETGISESAIEALHQSILHGLARFNKTESHLRLLGPLKHRPTRQLRAIVDRDLLREPMGFG